MFASTDIEEIFPSCLWMYDVADYAQLFDILSLATQYL